MSTISVTNIADGDAVTAASINNQVNTIINDYNGNITDANISASAAIGAQKLAGGTSGMFGAWTTWVPTLANMTTGNGTLTARYSQHGKTIVCYFKIVFGSTSTVGTAPTFTLPVTAASQYSSQFNPLCQAHGEDSGIAAYSLTFGLNASTTIVGIFAQNATGTYTAPTSGVTATAPFSWGPADWICGTFTYEAA